MGFSVMMASLKFSLLSTLALTGILLTTSCQNPTSSTPTAATDSSKIGFESGYNVSGVTASESDVKGGTMGMTFTLSAAQKTTGAQSLECQGTSQQNAYSTDFFGEASIPVPSAPVDFTGKSITVAILVPTGSEVSAVSLSTAKYDTGKMDNAHLFANNSVYYLPGYRSLDRHNQHPSPKI